jgi:hypothetical protein
MTAWVLGLTLLSAGPGAHGAPAPERVGGEASRGANGPAPASETAGPGPIPELGERALGTTATTALDGVALGTTAAAELDDDAFGATATTALTASDDLGEAPLSAEDLALLDALTTAPAPAPPPAQPWPAPDPGPWQSRTFAQPRLTEPIARTLTEAFAVLPALLGSPRLGGDTTLVVDGMLVETLRRELLHRDWLGVDPRLFASVTLAPHADPRLVAGTRGGTAALVGIAAPEGPGHTLLASVTARSADRSSGVLLRGGLAGELAGLSVTLGYDDLRPMRIATDEGHAELPTTAQRWSGSARARLLGRPEDPARLTFGVDLLRLQGARLPALGAGEVRQTLGQRVLAFARLDLGDQRRGGFVLAGYQDDRQALDVRGEEVRGAAQHVQLRGAGHLALSEALTWSYGGHAGLGTQGRTFDEANARTHRLEAFTALALSTSQVEALITARLLHLRFEPREDAAPSAAAGPAPLVPLLAAALTWRALGPLALHLAASRGAERRLANTPTTLTLEAGPRLDGERAWLQLSGFAQELPEESRRRVGLELEGAWSLTPRLHLAGAASWADDRPRPGDIARAPGNIEAFIALRLELPLRDAFVQAHLRAVSGAWRLFSPTAGSTRARAVTVGMLGTVGLARDLALQLALENVLDAPADTAWAAAPSAGIDLRALLTWRLP